MANTKKSYQDLQAELDSILDWFAQSTDINIDEALAKYEKAGKIIAELRAQLEKAENKIKEIKI